MPSEQNTYLPCSDMTANNKYVAIVGKTAITGVAK